MQVNRCFSDILLYNNTIDFSSYNLLRPNFEKLIFDLCIDRQQTYITPYQLIECISRIPEVRVINNLILPNWIINTSYDIDYVIHGLYKNPNFWAAYHSYNWINACHISVYQHKYLYALLFTIIEVLNHCKWLILSVPSFMTLTEFWDWLLKCPELNDEARTRIIFFTPKQAKTYRTAASGGSIPLDIAKRQNQFYADEYTAGSKILLQGDCKSPTKHPCTTTKDSNLNAVTSDWTNNPVSTGTPDGDPVSTGLSPDTLDTTAQPLIIRELDKLRTELIKYNLVFPDALQLETGGLLEKINNIREILGIGIAHIELP